MRFMKFIVPAVLAFALLAPASTPGADAEEHLTWVMNFEELSAGQVVSEISVGSGIEGEAVTGAISARGINPLRPDDNSAMIFNAVCAKGCSGNELTLKSPASGKAIIVSKDLDSTDPDSEESIGLSLILDFANWGTGEVVIDSLDMIGSTVSTSLEIDQRPEIEIFSEISQGLIRKVSIPDSPSTAPHTIPIGIAGVNRMRINFNGPAAIDNIRFAPSCSGNRVTILGTDGADRLLGTDMSDVILGLDGNDYIRGLDGNDYICGGKGSDNLFGDDGDDVLFGGALNDRIDGGRGNDLVVGEDGNDNLFGGGGTDRLVGGTGNDYLHGGGRDDILRGDAGDDRLHGTDGDDTLWGGTGDDLLYGGANNDILWGEEGSDSMFGNEGDDELTGGPGPDALIGGGGEDILIGGDGNDLLTGGDDDDNLRGGFGIDTLRGDGGDDYLSGGRDDDNLNGGPGTDWCLGGETLAGCE